MGNSGGVLSDSSSPEKRSLTYCTRVCLSTQTPTGPFPTSGAVLFTLLKKKKHSLHSPHTVTRIYGFNIFDGFFTRLP